MASFLLIKTAKTFDRLDGQGFDASISSHGFGLQSMRERAEELGGELAVESEPGKGTNIAVSIPKLDVI